MSTLENFASAILNWRRADMMPDSLLIERSGDFAAYYAPFEHLNPRARIALVGITPGLQQANNALDRAKELMIAGRLTADVLSEAKLAASFSGPMRRALVACLDAVGVPGLLGIPSSADLFDRASSLAHFTSILRYPVFFRGKNYTGSPTIESKSWLVSQVDCWFAEEPAQLPQAVFVPLGVSATRILQRLVEHGRLSREQILEGIPHPSPSNVETQLWFLGKRAPGTPGRRDGQAILAQRRALESQVS